jgi:hypothetical protein
MDHKWGNSKRSPYYKDKEKDKDKDKDRKLPLG